MKSGDHSEQTKDAKFLRNASSYASLPTRLAKSSGKPTTLDTTNKRRKSLKATRANQKVHTTAVQLQMPPSTQPYSALEESMHDFGMSSNLSTESVKNACEFYADFDDVSNDLSDCDFQETQQTPHAFRGKRSSSANFFQFPSDSLCRRQHQQSDEIVLCQFSAENVCTPRRAGSVNSLQQHAELSVLSELDSILAVHEQNGSQHNSSLCDYEDKIEDCLMDLDTYLEQLDNASCHVFDTQGSSTDLAVDCKRNRNVYSTVTLPRVPQSSAQALERRLSCSLGAIKDLATGSAAVQPSMCQRNSMRNTSIIDIPCAAEEVLATKSLDMPLAASAPTTARTSTPEMLTNEQIINNLLQTESQQMQHNRPRQYGRRAESETQARMLAVQSVSVPRAEQQLRPMSAPAARTDTSVSTHFVDEQHGAFAMYVGSDASSAHSSRLPSPLTVASSSDSGSSDNNESVHANESESAPTIRTQTALDPDNVVRRTKTGFNSAWPHSCSRAFAILCATLGLYNVSRFAILTVNYGGNFVLQFCLLSIIFGIPLLWLQMCLGGKIKAGPVSMWKISPICAGIGIALALVQCFVAIYSTVPIAWVLVYLKDTFPSKLPLQGYRWQDAVYSFRHDPLGAGNLTENVADYFNYIVLQRLQLANHVEGMRFRVNDRLAFYLAFVWSAVFLILCKGLRSYGRAVLLLATLPMLGFLVVTCKLLYVIDPSKLQNIFSSNDFDDFLINSKTWAAAAQEAFLTWGLLGTSVISVTSRSQKSANKLSLRREAIFVVLLTLLGLATAAVFGLCCIQLLKQHGYIYVPGSFERQETYTSVYSLRASIAPELVSFPTKWLPHYSSFVGETYRRPETLPYRESGFQALRLVTELLPATVALAGDSFSWIWTAVTFASLALMGLAQICVMWKPISSALGNSTSSVLLSCVTALLLSIPFATEMGISILYYIEFLIGGSWILPVLWTALIFGVFLIRGRPYNGDDLVNDLYMSSSLSAFLALSWNVLLPIGLVALSVIDYKISLSSQFYYWRGKAYFSYWSRKLGSLLQIGVLLLVPIVAIIQIYRYLTNGPPDILDRIQNLYRPPEDGEENRRAQLRMQLQAARRQNSNENNNERIIDPHNDAPPKYTPPPSYTTATGARLAKMLRQSLRRSVRRVLGDPNRTRTVLPLAAELNENSPPDYLTILTNNTTPSTIAEAHVTNAESIEIRHTAPQPDATLPRTLSLGRNVPSNKHKAGRLAQQQRPASATTSRIGGSGSSNTGTQQRPYTADDVVSVLRSSTRARRTGDTSLPRIMSEMLPQQSAMTFCSIENLILNAEPPGESPAVADTNDDDGRNTSNCNVRNNTSVI